MSELVSRQECAEHGQVYACVVAGLSLLRGFEIIVRARPKTLLRTLCAVSFDTIFRFRRSKRIPFQKIETLLMLLELGACINRFFDRKDFNLHAYRRLREKLKQAGMHSMVAEYVKQIKAIEKGRPLPNGDALRFQAIQAYREDVVRLSLALVTAAVFDGRMIDQGFEVLGRDDDFDIIFRIVMQCQVIDDVLDYYKDNAAGLPGFLTATTSKQTSAALTKQAVGAYRNTKGLDLSAAAFPFQLALGLVSVCALLVLNRNKRRAG